MRDFEEACVSRTARSVSRDEVVITEVWDTGHPNCPFVSYASSLVGQPYWRAISMDQREFSRINPPLR